jgi:hypothetical protein
MARSRRDAIIAAMRGDPSFPTVSIVLEWETGAESGGARAAECLGAIGRQMGAPRGGEREPELILVCDPGEGEAARAVAAGQELEGRCRVAEAPARLDYYAKKNFGFRLSRGEIVVFLDSDLAPEPGWLGALIAPFADPARNVVVGRTHFETRGLYERAMALFWIFDTRCPDDLVRPTRRLVSNNIAFRRALFAALPYPDRPTYRGQCSELGAKLGGLGISMFEATAARTAHPAPRGPAGFVRRAFRAGQDACAYRALEGPVRAVDWLAEWRNDLATARARRIERAPQIGAGPAARGAAALLGALYYSIKGAGYGLKMLRGGRMESRAPSGG